MACGGHCCPRHRLTRRGASGAKTKTRGVGCAGAVCVYMGRRGCGGAGGGEGGAGAVPGVASCAVVDPRAAWYLLACVCVCVCVCVIYVYIYVSIDIYVHIFTYMHACKYVCTHTHTYTSHTEWHTRARRQQALQ